jgi:hypothetical protein
VLSFAEPHRPHVERAPAGAGWGGILGESATHLDIAGAAGGVDGEEETGVCAATKWRFPVRPR